MLTVLATASAEAVSPVNGPGGNDDLMSDSHVAGGGWRRSWLLLALSVFFTCGTVHAATCATFSGTAVNFGNYTGTVISPGSSPFSINCAYRQTYQILLNQGLSSTGTETIRQMSNGTIKLNYGLFQDAGHTTNFGNSTASGYYAGTGSGATQTVPMYPQLTAGQNVAPGTYTDTITATLGGNSSGSTTFTVTAAVQPACTISATAISFGLYTGVQTDINSSVTVNCTNTTTWYVNLNDGNQWSTGWIPNMIGAGGVLLSYSKFRDVARSLYFGNTYNLDGIAGTGNGTDQSLPVYARLFANQYVKPGLYTDTIIAKVQF